MADILVPVLGESVTEATVAKWTKTNGDAVKKDEVLVELETDKVSLEVASPADGTLQILVGEGETVTPGTKLGTVGGAGAAAASAAPAAAAAPAAKAAAPAPAASGGAALLDVKTPVMGESVAEGTISTWRKKKGDSVKKDEVLVEIETDKVAVEVASPADGTLADILAADGATVTPGQVIAKISTDGSVAASSAPAAAAAPAPVAAAAPADTGKPLSPAVQRIVSETGLDPNKVDGTGKDGRITKGDALAALSSPAPAPVAVAPVPSAPAAPRAVGAREDRVKMTRLRQTIARRLKESQNTAAQLTTFNEVDMTAIMTMRNAYKDVFEKRHGVKLGFMSFFAKAVVAALKDIPAVNAEIEGTDIIYKNHYDLGIAVGTDKGLVVPVLRDVDSLSLAGIEKGIAALGKQARDGTLSIDQLQGGTFTITNGGIYGSLMSTPILNMPQVGILGMHSIKERPMAVNGQVVIRPMMYLALSYDHRIVDGKEAVTFLVRVKEGLEDPQRFVLDV
ncbi:MULTISPECIES: 2-oxoglutarate dehydrogenase complex dihydrolipoyllysine-residue succinyltransferase [Asticcacaulis]|uniref:2-oxoglutarate dehydrogenase complex dihydrolipoyllysine-residue succinyltransferase n=1 Tax=Asticcacaulis TaxID=76890 RepID=UPI001AE46859|nr:MULTISPECIES: 2-oxoglutarate dehydrogenase complex dihydrolipoyllysine-residue succinyltransferase [Asticcacaulis]MBP2160116.1 2-oxoglutarate dehydrogenase E2 component (dihydrolipoamide succinyltransferase) [Asticcacaulis solisilvae]MDR6801161.1 2-oxoglutarate dehydrogenase E2 component (dihydrolipoamide succinyltransferase) [Asticcacaulis sp. BE141]